MKKRSQLLQQSRFQLHRRRLESDVALYAGVYDTMYMYTECRTRQIHRTLVRRFYLRGNSKGDGQPRHRRRGLTGRRRDATTRRLKPWLHRPEFLSRVSSPSSRSSRIAPRPLSRVFLSLSFLIFISCVTPPFSRLSRLA
ncbi:hypothetical protein PUN28_013417 [Cardiocondyla obscurior]|uniref:Uncharacterized protein n=1 Tax=Cardiocondyla obscurior TaxID=286306 RepID=A0AAW2FDX0_9HYME